MTTEATTTYEIQLSTDKAATVEGAWSYEVNGAGILSVRNKDEALATYAAGHWTSITKVNPEAPTASERAVAPTMPVEPPTVYQTEVNALYEKAQADPEVKTNGEKFLYVAQGIVDLKWKAALAGDDEQEAHRG
ncbi:hypothetical protein AB0K08_13655 [Citricoccus sp. NPDC055426]|uniref:hypothetical protein n=1 Tax=Citricoccus sp. NPDC055426 TaxID=3155536 RepID=UPI00343816B9